MDTGTAYLNETSFKQMVENNWDSVVFANLEGTILYANSAAHKLYGYGADELIGQHVDIFNSQKTHQTEEVIQSILNKGGWSGELIQRRKDNSDFYALLTVSLIYDESCQPIGYASNSKNINERIAARNVLIKKQSELQDSLGEREALLAEIHHRLKNNLAIISSLLHIQEITSNNEETREIIGQCQSRIKSTALVHELLYENKSLTNINFKNYIQKLIFTIESSFSCTSNAACVNLQAEDIELNIQQAVPCGLLFNEILTNSYKHAVQGEQLIFDITITNDNGRIKMTLGDNGPGLPEDLDFDQANSTGLTLIKAFVDQLDGKINYKTNGGAIYEIEFKT